MLIVRNKIIPFGRFVAINLFGVLFVKGPVKIDSRLLNHEAIHSAQMRELGYIFFYLIYFIEWIWRLFRPGNAYGQLSFEREAYQHQSDPDYLSSRPCFAQWRNSPRKVKSGM
ncbi:MAG: hypothetical protein K2M31_04920 [Muribaculaceae bacterium]|nr:hypothetical protein [Muribaculaceae bacterium]